MTGNTQNGAGETDRPADASNNDRHVCRVTGREQGLVGKYDIRLRRQSFRELAPRHRIRKT